MRSIEIEILRICKIFIQIADTLYNNNQITYEQYMDMIKLKLDYIKKMDLEYTLFSS